MMESGSGNKFIIGWIKLREGTEEEFDRLSGQYTKTCRAEPECRFFEMMRTREEPLTVLVCEAFLSEEAHAVHLSRPHVKAFFEVLGRLGKIGDFENIIAQDVRSDRLKFETES